MIGVIRGDVLYNAGEMADMTNGNMQVYVDGLEHRPVSPLSPRKKSLTKKAMHGKRYSRAFAQAGNASPTGPLGCT